MVVNHTKNLLMDQVSGNCSRLRRTFNTGRRTTGSVKGCGIPARQPTGRGLPTALGQVSHKPRGRKPRTKAQRLLDAGVYGDLSSTVRWWTGTPW